MGDIIERVNHKELIGYVILYNAIYYFYDKEGYNKICKQDEDYKLILY